MLYFGQALLPLALFVAFKMQQRLGLLKVAYLLEASRILRKLKGLDALIGFPKPKHPKMVTISTMIDASHNGVNETYGLSGILCRFKIYTNAQIIYHPIVWTSQRRKKVIYFSFGAKILAAAAGDDLGYYLSRIWRTSFSKPW